MRINFCGEFLSFMANKDLSKRKIFGGNFCGNRFCPMCAWRQAKKDALKISICMKYIELEHKKSFIFLTLTAPNITGDKLSDEVTKYNLAFKNLIKRKEVKAINKGYIRKLEITYNENSDTYHPHFHVVIAVNESYFKSRDYIKQEKWLHMWRDVMENPTITQVDVRRMKKDTENKEILEIAKYAAKDSEMMINQQVFDTFYEALKGRQILTYNGLFKDANKLFKEKKLEKYKEIDETEYVYFLLYRWNLGQYVETEIRELTPEEKQKNNRKLIEESEVE
jgi:plasmid rolling circle replication initiator protein Rep